MKKITKKALDKMVSNSFYAHGRNRQYRMLDLPKIAKAGRDAYEATGDVAAIDAAIKAACDQYESP